MRLSLLAALAAAALCFAGATEAHADDYFHETEPDNVLFRIDKTRSGTEKVVIGSLLGGAALFGGFGVLFTLDSKSNADAVSASGTFTGEVYTPKLDSKRRHALRSRKLAIAGYAIGGAFLAASAVAYIVTDPGTEVLDMNEYQRREDQKRSEPAGEAALVPVRGGALVENTWAF